MSGRWWRLFILVSVMTAGAAPAGTQGDIPGNRWWGVVVGVGQYERLDASLALDGPPNDVPLVVTWLRRQGVPRRHLTILADQVARADGLPTRAAILAALQALPERMSRGDIAFLYFAGHGSQQPQGGSEWSKADGLDEIFLPRDVGRWDGASGRVEGAIVGREIGGFVEALRARGIFVWLVFDSCHSATMARAVMVPHLRTRGLPPDQLGIPRLAPAMRNQEPRASSPLVRMKGSAAEGGYVAFYAAQTVDVAPELPLPPGESASQVHGLFTYALLKALAATGAGSYREVAHRILAFYASTYPATTPEFEGVLDGAIGAPGAPLLSPNAWPAQHSATGFHIDSGSLNRITPQSLLALYAAIPASTRAAPLGLLRVTKVTLSDAWAVPVRDRQDLKAWNVAVDRSSEVATGVVRLLRTSVDTAVRIAGPAACFASLQPPFGCAAPGAGDGGTVELARRIATEVGCLPPGAEFTPDIDAADLFLLVRNGRLFVVLPTTRSIEAAVAISLDSRNAAAELRRVLFKATRSVALLRLAGDFSETSDDLAAEVRTREPAGRWRPVAGQGSPPVPFGAELAVQLQNISATDLDVTILAIDDRFGITPVYPVDQESNLLRAGSARVEVSGWARTPGANELVFIIERARAGRAHDLGYLAQPGVARHTDGTGLAALLERIGFSAHGTRSSVSEDDRQSSSIKIIRYDVLNST